MFSRKLLKLTPFLILTSLNVLALSSRAAHAGGTSGGGGDAATEMRIDEIRSDILKWISEGGAQGLKLPLSEAYEKYVSKMTNALLPHNVVVSAVTTQQESTTPDAEQKVSVDGQAKTCRGFVSVRDQQRHILCNVERFANTSEAGQYQLIHHEYAGLVGVEQNLGASSDYAISSQITAYLTQQTVLKLSVKKRPTRGSQIVCNWNWLKKGGEIEKIQTVFNHLIGNESIRGTYTSFDSKDVRQYSLEFDASGTAPKYVTASNESSIIYAFAAKGVTDKRQSFPGNGGDHETIAINAKLALDTAHPGNSLVSINRITQVFDDSAYAQFMGELLFPASMPQPITTRSENQTVACIIKAIY